MFLGEIVLTQEEWQDLREREAVNFVGKYACPACAQPSRSGRLCEECQAKLPKVELPKKKKK